MRDIMQLDVTNVEFNKNPYPLYEALHAQNAIARDSNLNAFFFGHYEDVSKILRSQDFTTTPLASRAEPVMGDRVLAQMEGHEHHSKRHAVVSGLTGKMFRERHASMIADITNQLLSKKLESGHIDLINDFGKEYSILVALKVLGLPVDRFKDVSLWLGGITGFITSFQMCAKEREYSLDCSRYIIKYLTPIVEEQISWPNNSLISVLCQAEDSGQKMTTSEIVALVLNVLLAATEPADKTLAYLFYHLLAKPGQLNTVKTNREHLIPAIGETLRLTSPVQLIPRQARREVNIAGIDLPAGTVVFCMIGAANRDPAVFPLADKFILDRKMMTKNSPDFGRMANHLAFGAGMHVCVGAAFSLMQIQLTANLILDNLNEVKFASNFVLQEEGLYTRGPIALPLIFQPHISNNHSSEEACGVLV